MIDDGADILDIGGESTRPGSDPVSLDEELRRTIPVIETLAKNISIPISIDTYKSDVAVRALEAGALIVNDISGMRFDPEMPSVISRFKVPVVIMHIKGTPKNMQVNPTYKALVPEVMDYFRASIRLAAKSGIPEDMIILDPGIGFGKTYEHNLEIINNLDQFSPLERPLLIGPSRKAFLERFWAISRLTRGWRHRSSSSDFYHQRCAHSSRSRRKRDGKGSQSGRCDQTPEDSLVIISADAFFYNLEALL